MSYGFCSVFWSWMQVLRKIRWLYCLSLCLGTQRLIVGISLLGGILIFSKICSLSVFLVFENWTRCVEQKTCLTGWVYCSQDIKIISRVTGKTQNHTKSLNGMMRTVWLYIVLYKWMVMCNWHVWTNHPVACCLVSPDELRDVVVFISSSWSREEISWKNGSSSGDMATLMLNI